MGRKSASGIRDEQPGSYFLELRNHFFGLKYLNSLMGIRDPEWRQFGSGMEKSWIRDKHPGSATLPSKVQHPNMIVRHTDLRSCHGCRRLQVPPPWRVCPARAPADHSQLLRPQYSSAHTQNLAFSHVNQPFRRTVAVCTAVQSTV